ncbi:hypothetical protein C8D92_10153 [Tamilnaduibacter salinus]|uniref:Uncharacterized protein n=1 Tax=Tamilnaduibacter salinus TaxID=1484056 RepID=A0A2A2I313_9GAMM|nr:hypothetical protein [Tamilnaduibacter salinus]PAV26017.1 hypothetical protein CF392_07870 [Tamilnaduibacter salinus]PVY78850.1 hypothetical protein C8D92_10153 [Tamilnaduibacter salinus]
MKDEQHYEARLARGNVVPTLLCGHCESVIPKARIFSNEGDRYQDVDCDTVGLCFADDCGAVNCCDNAMKELDQRQQQAVV